MAKKKRDLANPLSKSELDSDKNKKAKEKVDEKYGEENRLKARMSQEYSRLNESTTNPSPWKRGGKIKKKSVNTIYRK